MAGDGLEKLAFSLSLRSLEHQEATLDDLRSRTGTLLAASALVASFLGSRVLEDGLGVLAVLALLAFLISILASVYVLLPKPHLIFSLRGSVLFEEEADDPGGLDETHRKLAYWLDGYRDSNEPTVEKLFRTYGLATAAVVVEVILWMIELTVS